MSNGRPKPDDFARSVTRMSVAQICETVGFDGSKESALDALTDVAIRFICDLGKSAASSAGLSGRSHCNFFDIVRGLEDLGVLSLGHLGASGVDRCLTSSGVVNEVVRFVESNEDVPFAQPVPRFPVVRERKLIPSFERMEETPPGKHVPAWLPALPDPHTYVHTPVWSERASDPREEKIEQARQRRKAERALLNLQQRLVGKNDDLDIVSVEQGKSRVSVMEAFAPAIEAVKEVGLGDDGDGERKLLPEKRPVVNFRIKMGRKLLCDSLDLSLARKVGGTKKDWLGRDDERDDKKRRAEFILRHSMENPQELTQI